MLLTEDPDLNKKLYPDPDSPIRLCRKMHRKRNYKEVYRDAVGAIYL